MTPPAKSKSEFSWAAAIPTVPRMVSDGCPQPWTSAAFQISQTEFKKSFLRLQA
jgi:hypothetical protein